MPHIAPHDPLACDCCTRCGMTTAAPALLGAALGLALTAGWVIRTAWQVAHRPESLAWLLGGGR